MSLASADQLEEMAAAYEAVAEKLRSAAVGLRAITILRGKLSCAQSLPDASILEAVPEPSKAESKYRGMRQALAAETYINEVGRAIEKQELFEALRSRGAKVSSMEGLAVALSRHSSVTYLKGSGWVTRRVMMSLTKKSIMESQQFYDTKNPQTSPEQADPEG